MNVDGETKKQAAQRRRMDRTSASISGDESANNEFDALLKYATQTETPIIDDADRRKRGRPKDGRLVFGKKTIDSLPHCGHLSEVARRLGIKHTTLQQWCVLDIHPLPYVKRGGHKFFRKDVLVTWLTATKRFED